MPSHPKISVFIDRSSRSQMFLEIDVLKDFAIFTGKHLCWSLFLIKLQTLMAKLFTGVCWLSERWSEIEDSSKWKICCCFFPNERVVVYLNWFELLFFLIWLTFSWRRPLSYRNQSTDLRCTSMDWVLYDRDLLHERVEVLPDRTESNG